MAFDTASEAGGDDAGPSAAIPRESQRDRLLHGMACTVARRGYAATPVAEVLKAAGVSRRTFYEQFTDKEDCFLAAYDAIVAVCTDRVVAAYQAEDTWEDGTAHACAALLATLAAEPDFAHLGVVDVLAAGPRAVARREAVLQRFARFVDWTRTHAAVGPPPARRLGQAIVGGIHELVYSQIVQGHATRLPQLSDELLHYVFVLLGVPRQLA